MQNENSRNIGVGFWGLLGLLFIALKLMGHIDWSWWWVLAPIWGPVALIATIIILVFIVGLIISCIKKS